MSKLDHEIVEALSQLEQQHSPGSFDYAAYISKFAESAREKALAVLGCLKNNSCPFCDESPVFVSIGGGDGTELIELLTKSTATKGILVEMAPELAEAARQKTLPVGKDIYVLEGDAQKRLEKAMTKARDLVIQGAGDFVVVTCHAVLHELFDRGEQKFDPTQFFAEIFGDEDAPSIWLTYREPGAPEKWSREVLVKADCQPSLLLGLARAITSRHKSFEILEPQPMVVGDDVRMHRNLAMETIAKLFYLDDLAHEIEERSTAVEHNILLNYVMLAIGDKASTSGRSSVTTKSAPTQSFEKYSRQFGIQVKALGADGATNVLAIAESQTRVIAWRQAKQTHSQGEVLVEDIQSEAETQMTYDIQMARNAFATRDDELLGALLASHARAWIESNKRDEAVKLLGEIESTMRISEVPHIWSHYITSIAKLFSGEAVSATLFANSFAKEARQHGLGLLYDAEFMEFCRKHGDLSEAVSAGNRVIIELNDGVNAGDGTTVRRYVLGTASFLIANLLRFCGRYSEAWSFIEQAEGCFQVGIPSHDTEIAHCAYAKAVCAAMTGVAQIEATPLNEEKSAGRQFANALIILTYSHAAWFVDDAKKARDYASDAEKRFRAIDFPNYAHRAQRLCLLLEWWSQLEAGKRPHIVRDESTGAHVLSVLLNEKEDMKEAAKELAEMKPSIALGILQFSNVFDLRWSEAIEIQVPKTLTVGENWELRCDPPSCVHSLAELDACLRDSLNIPVGRRLPLLAD